MAELTHLQTASAWAALHARRNMRKKAFKWAVALCAGLTLVAAWTDSAAGARLTFRMVLPFLALYFGAGALREEVEDQTLTYSFTRSLGRAWVFGARVVAALAPILVLALPVALITGGQIDALTAARFGLATLLGSLAYVAFFAFFGMFARWSTTVGVMFVLFWESLTSSVPGLLGHLTIVRHVMTLAGLNAEGALTSGSGTSEAMTSALALSLVAAMFFVLGGMRVRAAEFVLDKS
jgi:hypothetical protein